MEPIARRRVYNRILAVLLHLNRYGCRTQVRLAEDAGASEAAISRLLSGQSNPSYCLAVSVLEALERHLGKRIDPREILSLDGKYATNVCTLCGCPGCLPPQVYEADEIHVRPEYAPIQKGKWAFTFEPPDYALKVVPEEAA